MVVARVAGRCSGAVELLVPCLKGPVRLAPRGPFGETAWNGVTAHVIERRDSEAVGVSPWLYASGGSVRRDHDEYKSAMGEWIDGLGDWTLFVTRTLGEQSVVEGEPSAGTARRCLRDLLVRSQARKFVCVFELQKRGVPHLHALLETSAAFRLYDEQERDYRIWGLARWKVFTGGGGAPGYVGKYLAKDAVEMYVGLDGPYGKERLKGKDVGGTRV